MLRATLQLAATPTLREFENEACAGRHTISCPLMSPYEDFDASRFEKPPAKSA
jgi:hypothetical protein